MSSPPPLALSPPEKVATPRIGPRWIVGLLIGAYFIFAALAGTQSPCDNDLGGVFLPSARFVAAGQPLDMYQVRVGIYPNANGPLGEVLIGGAFWVGHALKLDSIAPRCAHPDQGNYPAPGDSIALRMWFSVLFAIFPLLIGRELLRLADRALTTPLDGWRRLIVWMIILLTPAVWDCLVYYGHIEQTVAIWLALLAVRWFGERRVLLAGIALGLALLNRTAEIFIVIPLALLLLRDRRWLHLLGFGAAIGGTMALGLGPLLLHDRANVVYSLLTFRSQLAIGDGSFWTFFRYTTLEHTAQSLDSTVGIAAAALVSAIVLWGGRVREDEPALYGVIALSVLWFSLSIKAIWGYYFYDPLIWVLAWTLAQPTLDWRYQLAGEAQIARFTVQMHLRWWALLLTPLALNAALGLTEWRISLSNPSFTDTGMTRVAILWMSAATTVVLMAVEVTLIVSVFRRHHEQIHATGAEKSAQIPQTSREAAV